jgi:phosphotransferase system HPr (HPr) family protein
MMIFQEIQINNNDGFHLRTASELVERVKHGSSSVNLIYNEQTASAESLLSVLKLGIKRGSMVTLVVDGPDEEIMLEKVKLCLT